MRPEQLTSFVVVAEEAHFGRAAVRLGITTAALSRRIQALERELETRVFQRTSRRVELTSTGRALLGPARDVLERMDAMTSVMAEIVAGRAGFLRAVYCGGDGPLMGRLIRQLRTGRPHAEVWVDQRTSRQVNEAVTSGEAAIGLSRLRPQGLASMVMASTPRDTFLMASDHPLAAKDVIQAEDLAGRTIAEPDPGNGVEVDSLARWPGLGVDVKIYLESATSQEIFLDRVAASDRLYLSAEGALTNRPRADIVARRFAGPPVSSPVTDFLIWRADDPDPLVAAMVDIGRRLATVPGDWAADRPEDLPARDAAMGRAD